MTVARWHAIHVLLLGVFTAGVFSNTLENDYHLDSVYRVKNNTEIDEFWPPSRFFTDIRTGSTIPQIAEYRPMMPLSHAINNEITRAIDADKLAGYHVGNIAIHIGTVILVYYLFAQLLGRWARPTGTEVSTLQINHAAFAAALIFAVHPISGSAVNYIAARDLLLMVFFLLASMRIYISMRLHGDSVSGWALSLALLCTAILSKQVAILGFALVFLIDWILMNMKLRDWRLWLRTIGFGIPVVAFFVLRGLWIVKQNTQDPLRLPTDIYNPLTMAKAHLYYYLRNFVWPFEMRALADFKLVENLTDPAMLAGLIFIILSLAIAWMYKRKQPLLCFSILAYWLLFSLTSSIFPFRYVVTDYRQYLPFVFLCLIIGLALVSSKHKNIIAGVVACMFVYFAGASYAINQHWKTEESFWAQSVKYGARGLAHNNYALQISRRNPELAKEHYLKALEQNPNHIYATINLGMLQIRQNQTESGIKLLRQGVEKNPNMALAHYWLARGLKDSGADKESLIELKRAADLDVRQLQYQYETAEALQRNRDTKGSITYLERIIDINPNYQWTGFLLGYAHQKQGDNQRAISEYARFLDIQPDNVQAHFNLAYALMNEGNCELAIPHYKTALQLRPTYNEVNLHLSRCYAALGDNSQASRFKTLYEQ
jgi:tetratricopeptide (TPR) repeat protein